MASDVEDKLITAIEISIILGSTSKNIAFKMLLNDDSFPMPAKIGKRGRGESKTLWRLSEIQKWIELDATRKRDKSGRRMGAVKRTHVVGLDNALALDFTSRGRWSKRRNTDRPSTIDQLYS